MNAQTTLAWSLTIAEIALVLAMACAVFRLVRGPRAQDRVVGLDALYLDATLLLLTFGIHSGTTLYFEAALVVQLPRTRQRIVGRLHHRRAEPMQHHSRRQKCPPHMADGSTAESWR